MKIRAWHPNPTDDADAIGEIRAADGPDFGDLDQNGSYPESAGQETES